MNATVDIRSWRDRSVLVTGGLGFIGSNLVRRLVAAEARVAVVDCAIDDFLGANPANLADVADRLRLYRRDMADDDLDDVVAGRDAVFNLAGRTSHPDSMRDPLSDMRANVEAQIRLLDACRARAPRAAIVFAGTRQVYGRPRALPVDESHPLNPPDVNGIHKLAGEMHHLLYAAVHGMGCCSLRLTNTYGPRMRIKDARQNFLGFWIRCVLEGRPFEVWGGEQRRDLAFVDDVVDAFLLAAATPSCVGRALNVGGAPPLSLRAIADALIADAGAGSYVIKEFPPERKAIDIGSYQADDRAFRQATGWRPETGFAEGLRRTVDYYRTRLADYR